MTVVAGHRPHLAMTPGDVGPGVLDHRRLGRRRDRHRPPPTDRFAGLRPGLPTAPGPLGHVDARAEPRGRHARISADDPDVFKGPRRCSGDFFQTRNSTAASPSAVVRSADLGPELLLPARRLPEPAARPARPVSMNCRLQFGTDCSDTFHCRVACATITSPASTASTTRTFPHRQRRRTGHDQTPQDRDQSFDLCQES